MQFLPPCLSQSEAMGAQTAVQRSAVVPPCLSKSVAISNKQPRNGIAFCDFATLQTKREQCKNAVFATFAKRKSGGWIPRFFATPLSGIRNAIICFFFAKRTRRRGAQTHRNNRVFHQKTYDPFAKNVVLTGLRHHVFKRPNALCHNPPPF